MANEEHLKILRQGVAVWNAWRVANPGIQPDLSGVDLSSPFPPEDADLFYAHFMRFYDFYDDSDLDKTNLNGINFSRADLSEAKFIWTNLIRANLT